MILEQAINLAESWYERTAGRPAARAVLTATLSADVCVIGGGFAGLHIAHELARLGRKVVLLEATRLAAAASGRNGGFVSNGFALGVDGIEKRVGGEAARALYALSRSGTEKLRNLIVAHDASIKMGDGLLVCQRHDDRGAFVHYCEGLREKFAEEIESLKPSQTREKLLSARYFDSVYFPKPFQIHPLRLALLLARLAEASGALLFEHSVARSVAKAGAAWRVSTDHGSVDCEHVVHCVSASDRKLHRATGRAILPVATYVAVTQPLQQDAIRFRGGIADPRRAGDYYRLIDEERLLWGGRITTRVSEPSRLADRMAGDIRSVYPQLGHPRMDFAWAGLMGYALHKMPLIGRDTSGQWFATAFGGHGLNTTAMAGELIARAIVGESDEYRRFAAFAPDWAWGPLGRVGVQGSYWWMQARDRFDEKFKRGHRL